MNHALYAAKEVWDQSLQTGQANLLRALQDFWPEGVTTALDVGCGDGKLSARLAEYANGTVFVGLDSSAEALSRVPFARVEGDAAALPFADDSFDLVMTMDMLEHLPDAQEAVAWQELFRVAADTVMVVVPFREDLSEARTCCQACGHAYHVNWHQRRYDVQDVHRHVPKGWHIQTTVLSGEKWSQMLPPEIHLRRTLLGEQAGWELSVCPKCGAHGHAAPVPQPLPALLAQSMSALIYPALRQQRWHRNHSEILVVFQRARDKKSVMPSPEAAQIYPQPATCIDFSHQPVEVNLVPFCQVAHCVAGTDGQLRLQFPLYEAMPLLEVQRKTGGTQGPLHLLLEDAAGVLWDDVVLGADEAHASLTLPRVPVAGYYGILGTCARDIFASIRLGQGPEIIWMQPPSPGACGYWRAANTTERLFVQVPASLWVDPECLPDEPPYPSPTFDELLAHVDAYWTRAVTQQCEALVSQRDRFAEERNRLEVQVQNLSTERDALVLQRDRFAEERNRLEVQVQNLSAEREALVLQRDRFAEERNRLEVQVQNLSAERDALVLQRDGFAEERNRLEVQVQNLSAERDALVLQRDGFAEERNRLEVQVQNLSAERDEIDRPH